MNEWKEQWIKYKISQLHPKDLIHYGAMYGLSVSYQEAAQILQLVQQSNWSLNDKQSLETLLQQAKQIVSPQAYQVLKELYDEYLS